MLSKSSVFTDACESKNRLIIINHVGVLSTNRKDLASVSRLLSSLSNQEGFNVVLISPCSRRELDESFARACPKLILVAENGVFYKVPKQDQSNPIIGGQSTTDEWENLLT